MFNLFISFVFFYSFAIARLDTINRISLFSSVLFGPEVKRKMSVRYEREFKQFRWRVTGVWLLLGLGLPPLDDSNTVQDLQLQVHPRSPGS